MMCCQNNGTFVCNKILHPTWCNSITQRKVQRYPIIDGIIVEIRPYELNYMKASTYRDRRYT